MVGTDHATKPDTVNRLATAAHGVDGLHYMAGVDTGRCVVVTDCDSATINGLFYAAASAANIPGSDAGYFLSFAYDSSGNYVKHLWANVSDDALLVRTKNAGTWGAWVQVVDSDSWTLDIPGGKRISPDGYIEQWGTYTGAPGAGNQTTAISFATPFTTDAIQIQITPYNVAASDARFACTAISSTGFTLGSYLASDITVSAFWRATGY